MFACVSLFVFGFKMLCSIFHILLIGFEVEIWHQGSSPLEIVFGMRVFVIVDMVFRRKCD